MKKTILIPIITCIAILVLQQCKTTKEATSIQQNPVKDTVQAQQLVKDSIFDTDYSDTICYIFNNEEISNISEKFHEKFNIEQGKPYSEFDLYLHIVTIYGVEAANEFVSIASQYGEKKTRSQIVDERTSYYINALETGEYIYIDSQLDAYFPKKLEKIDTIPDLIKQLYASYPIFNLVNISNYDRKITNKIISTIYKGNITELAELFNIALKENNKKLNLDLDEKIFILFQVIKGFDNKFSIEELYKVPLKDITKGPSWNYELELKTPNNIERYGIMTVNGNIYIVYSLLNKNTYIIATPKLPN